MDQEKVFFEGSEKKEDFFRAKDHRLKKPRKFAFVKGVSRCFFFQKNGDFLIIRFYAKWIKKKCFVKVPKEKKPF